MLREAFKLGLRKLTPLLRVIDLGGLNKIFLAKALPVLFKADGLCDTPYPPILGLSMPAWALIWFVIFALVLGVTFFAKKKARELFGKGH